MKATIAIIAAAILAVGCSSAPKSSEVGANYVPSNRYESMSCERLANEAESIRRAIPALAQAVDAHRSQQTAVEVVTWVLFWPAAIMLDKGADKSSQLAAAKGELEAITVAQRNAKCAG